MRPIWKILCVVLTSATTLVVGCTHTISPSDKSAFLKLIAELPHKGEFFTDAAIDKAAPSAEVLLKLTPQDLTGQDLYWFLALSRGLCDRDGPRQYAVQHFTAVAHPEIQMFWAVILFDKGTGSPEIVRYLDAALNSDEKAQNLAKIVGPHFSEFRGRVRRAAGG